MALFLATDSWELFGFPFGSRMRDSAIARLLDLDASRYGSAELAPRFYEWTSAKNGWLTEGVVLVLTWRRPDGS